MTQLYVHPMIHDNFVEYDLADIRRSPADRGPADLRRQVMQDYVGEKVILIRNPRIDYDAQFIRQVHFPHNWSFKKFGSSILEAAGDVRSTPGKSAICDQLFGGDVGRYAYFEQQVNAVNAQLRGVLDEILSHHDIAAKDIVWRHTETRVENLHFDEDRNSDAIESVRAYLNMDEVPRIWHTTHTLSLLMAHYYSELDLKRYENEPLERLLHVLSVRLFGNWRSRGREQFPHHMVLFEPGDLWITDGRTVPHQVIYGRRVISTFYRLAIDHLPDWHPSLSNRVRQLHRSLQAGPDNRPYDNGEPAYDMRGLAYPFGEAGPKPPRGVKPIDLRADWATIYEESIQQTLVRL